MESIRIYKLTMHGSNIHYNRISDLLGTIESEMGEMDDNGLEIKLSYEMMTQEQFEALPEFKGF